MNKISRCSSICSSLIGKNNIIGKNVKILKIFIEIIIKYENTIIYQSKIE